MATEKIENGIANPSPLGLLGFGMTTLLLNLHNASIIPLSAVILAMGLCLGGAAQIIAGIMEFRKNNTFGATAFTAYGFFWLSLVAIWVNPFPGINKADEKAWVSISLSGRFSPLSCSSVRSNTIALPKSYF